MAVSKLATQSIPADATNYTKGRQGKKIRKITVHHMAGVLTASACGAIFQNPNRNGSSHYGIGYDGSIANYVDEDNTAWTDSNWESNTTSVTIETSNSAVGGLWPVNEVTFNALVKLVADIAKRNNLGELKPGDNLTWHRMYTATSCPGETLLSRMDELAVKANAINAGKEIPSDEKTLSDYTDLQLANMVIHGDFGNGEARRAALGARYDAVQRIVNDMLMPNQEKKEDKLPDNLTGKTVVPIKLQDVNGTPLRQYDPSYTVKEDDGKSVVLEVRGAIWARLPRENVRLV